MTQSPNFSLTFKNVTGQDPVAVATPTGTEWDRRNHKTNPNALVVYFPLSFLILKVNSIGIDSWNPITISRSQGVS
ncbi:hypothetical protein CDV36_016212 [Fusarium kuroshium]|uniref:Uncharacterized protein n=2 Tax=Fusarium solani species complex TaxID=232080 RepID=A0A428NJW8_9HYPO|nr:hypothetical protein CDV36_016212 [Fusarium kuroshium]RSL40989.1 hypothetical protein CEP54_015954 [Fusarium duplospermum]